MIITYSYLDQYKQIELGTPIDFFVQTEIVETPFPLSITLSESVEYGMALSRSSEYGTVLSELVKYNITLSESAGGA